MISNRISRLLRTVAAGCLTLLLIACDGGISGSSNGGGSPGPGTDTGPGGSPDKLLIGYSIKNLPQSISAKIPASLLNRVQQSVVVQQPTVVLSNSILEARDLLLRFGVFQLYVDRSWDQIQTYCLDTLVGVSCDLTDSGISFSYSLDMAVWETQLRRNLYGGEAYNPTEGNPDLHSAALAKLGSTISLSGGAFRVAADEEYRYEVRMNLPEFNTGNVVFQLRWNKELTYVEATVSDYDLTEPVHFRSIYNAPATDQTESQQFILTTQSEQKQKDTQYTQHKVAGEDNTFFVESQLRVIDQSGTTEIFSRGKVDDEGGFIQSETITEDTDSEITIARQRELLGEDSYYSYSECDVSLSANGCNSESDWDLLLGPDPTQSIYFVSQEELDLLSTDFGEIGLNLLMVSDTADSYMLLKRFPLDETVTAEPIVGLLGLLTSGLLGGLFTPPEVVAPIDLLANLDSRFLCRVFPIRSTSGTSYRAFCNATKEELSDAMVVSEFLENGEYQTRFEVDAQVIVE